MFKCWSKTLVADIFVSFHSIVFPNPSGLHGNSVDIWCEISICMPFHLNNPPAAPPRVPNTYIHQKVTWIKTCSANLQPHLMKTINPTVLGLGLRMPIPRCFSGSFQETAMSTPRCTMRRSRRWQALSITARTPSTSFRARSSLMTTWTLRL